MTRREILLCTVTRLYGGSSEFWNRKDTSEWSADEIDRMITNSPWAKEITTPKYSGIVRWESAKPVIEAMKAPLPAEFANHYVISVSGIPMRSLSRRNEEATGAEARARQREIEGILDRLKGLTYLEPKHVQPGIVQETPFGVGETRTILFGFPKPRVQLSPDDKEVTFTTRMETTIVKAKFNLQQMTYRNELAV